MEDRVKCILLLLEEEADSFSKRAEMDYKSRLEGVSSMEEVYRAYHMSGELHKGNHTVATAFPDQVRYSMLEEEDQKPTSSISQIGGGQEVWPIWRLKMRRRRRRRQRSRGWSSSRSRTRAWHCWPSTSRRSWGRCCQTPQCDEIHGEQITVVCKDAAETKARCTCLKIDQNPM